jgi:hypothetical protein
MFIQSCVARNVFLICERNCKVDNNTISGGIGENIVLKYMINITEFVMLKINYEETEFITVQPSTKKLKVQNAPSFIDTSRTKFTTFDAGYEFSFALKSKDQEIRQI